MASKFPSIRENRLILPLVCLVLLLSYLYVSFVFRPANRVSFPGVEGRIWAASLVFLIASALAYLAELTAPLRTLWAAFAAIADFLFARIGPSVRRLLGGILSSGRGACARLLSRFPAMAIGLKKAAASFLHFLPIIFGPVRSALSFLQKALASLFWAFLGFLAKFRPSQPYYFATLALAAFLILSPLVIFEQKELADPALLLFAGFAIHSRLNQLDARVMVVTAMLFLLSCPVFILVKADAAAELAAIYASYSLATGVILQIMDCLRNPERYDEYGGAEPAPAGPSAAGESGFRANLLHPNPLSSAKRVF